MQAGQVNLLELPLAIFLRIVFVVVTPALKVAGRQAHIIEHRPDSARGRCAGQLDFRHVALMYRCCAGHQRTDAVDQHVATLDLDVTRQIPRFQLRGIEKQTSWKKTSDRFIRRFSYGSAAAPPAQSSSRLSARV